MRHFCSNWKKNHKSNTYFSKWGSVGVCLDLNSSYTKSRTHSKQVSNKRGTLWDRYKNRSEAHSALKTAFLKNMPTLGLETATAGSLYKTRCETRKILRSWVWVPVHRNHFPNRDRIPRGRHTAWNSSITCAIGVESSLINLNKHW